MAKGSLHEEGARVPVSMNPLPFTMRTRAWSALSLRASKLTKEGLVNSFSVKMAETRSFTKTCATPRSAMRAGVDVLLRFESCPVCLWGCDSQARLFEGVLFCLSHGALLVEDEGRGSKFQSSSMEHGEFLNSKGQSLQWVGVEGKPLVGKVGC